MIVLKDSKYSSSCPADQTDWVCDEDEICTDKPKKTPAKTLINHTPSPRLFQGRIGEFEMTLPTYRSGSGASGVSNTRDTAAQDDMSGNSPEKRGDAARVGDGSFAEPGGEANASGDVAPDAAERALRMVGLSAPDAVRPPAASGEPGGRGGAASLWCKNVVWIDDSESPRLCRVRAGLTPPRSSGEL